MNTRRQLPNRRGSERVAIENDGVRYLFTFSRFDDGTVAELFCDWAGKPNSQISTLVSTGAILTSLLLQHGISAAAIRHSIGGPIASALSGRRDQ